MVVMHYATNRLYSDFVHITLNIPGNDCVKKVYTESHHCIYLCAMFR